MMPLNENYVHEQRTSQGVIASGAVLSTKTSLAAAPMQAPLKSFHRRSHFPED
ncbi:hypothetical protein OROMI_016973 [Orobanche minor]